MRRRSQEKFLGDIELDEGALRKKMDIPEGEKVPIGKARAELKRLEEEAKGDKKLSPSDLKYQKQLNLFVNVLHPASQKKGSTLRERAIRLAHAKPELRGHLLPLLIQDD
ncbi:MAG: hypothetical protein ACYTFG_02250 [Planctomycetota bacterium]|jgi:hypothetical protein